MRFVWGVKGKSRKNREGVKPPMRFVWGDQEIKEKGVCHPSTPAKLVKTVRVA